MKKLRFLHQKTNISSIIIPMAVVVSAQISQADGLPLTQTMISDIEIEGDNLWLAQGATIIKRDKISREQLKYVVSDENNDGLKSVRNITVKSAGDVWFSCTASGVGHYDGEGFEVTNPATSVSRSAQCQYVAVDNDGAVWVACGMRGFYKRDGVYWTKVYEYGGGDMYAAYINTGMAFDDDNQLWWCANQSVDGFGYCSAGAGWYCISSVESYRETYDNCTYNTMTIDSRGNKWLGLQYPAVMKHSADGSNELFSLAVGSSDGTPKGSVFDAQIGPDGRVWVAHQDALYAFTGKDDIERIELPFSDDGVRIRSFKHDGDGIWIGTAAHGLFLWRAGQLESVDLSAGISDVMADEAAYSDVSVYDIMGRRVESTIPGNLYISAGRKFIAQ